MLYSLADANRAISAPLNIWNDQQDSIAQRDAGWLQIYVENAQEALDTTLMAYKVSENPNVLLPSMVCLDGFILTHTVEPVEIPDQESVDKFLPPYVPEHAYLDPKEPMSIGNFADPDYYTEARYAMEVAMNKSMDVIQKTCSKALISSVKKLVSKSPPDILPIPFTVLPFKDFSISPIIKYGRRLVSLINHCVKGTKIST